MRKLLLPLVYVLVFLISCSEETIPPAPDVKPEAGDLSKKTKAASTLSGLTSFKVSNITIPSGGLPDGKYFYGGLLRSNVSYNPYAVTKVLRDNIPRIRFYVRPTSPSAYLVDTPYPYHHRAEFTRTPWKICHPLGTEEWLGFSYIFPTSSEGYKQNWTPVVIYQNHAGRIGTQTSNPPALFIEVAYPGQLNSSSVPDYKTPYGGEIMIINKVRNIRWVVPDVRVVAGARINFVIQIVYGLGNEGLFNVWVNGKLTTFRGNGVEPPGNVGSTVWPPKTSEDIPVGGNSKLGIYHHQLKYKWAVDHNASKGHTKMVMFMTDWNDLFRYPGDADYKKTAYSTVSTAEYP